MVDAPEAPAVDAPAVDGPAAGERRGQDRRLLERRGRRAAGGAPVADRVLAAVCAEPWAISAEGLARVLAVVSREELHPEALQARAGVPLDNTRTVTVADGVATVPVTGVLTRYADFFTAISGGTTYATLAKDLTRAVEDPAVRAVLLSIDSPGGEVNGCGELAALVAAACQRKPVVAYVGGEGCSAAYWLASACDQVVAASTALVGCLGVRMSVTVPGPGAPAPRTRTLEWVSSHTPDKALDPTTDAGSARVLALVDALAAVFLGDVARYRGLSPAPDATAVDPALLAHMARQFGAGEVFVGADAVARGLADRVGTYEALRAELALGRLRTAPAVALLPAFRPAPPSAPDVAGDATRAAAAAASPLDPSPTPEAVMPRTPAAPAAQAAAVTPVPAVAPAAAATPAAEPAVTSDPATPAAAEPAATPAAEPAADPAAGSGAVETAETAAIRFRTEGAATERARILGILGHAKHTSMATLTTYVADASCSPADAASRILEAGAAAGAAHLTSLANDEAALGAGGAKPGALGPGATAGAAGSTRGPSMAEMFAAQNPGRTVLRRA